MKNVEYIKYNEKNYRRVGFRGASGVWIVIYGNGLIVPSVVKGGTKGKEEAYM